MPEATLDAVADGAPVTADTITPNLDHAGDTIAQLSQLGIDLDEVTAQLEAEGVTKFEQAWTELLAAVDAAR
jgi:transaldolase